MAIRAINSVFMRHGRWVFAIFTVVIIVSFLGFLTPGKFGISGLISGGDAVATVFGKGMSVKDLRKSMEKLRVLGMLTFPREVRPEEAVFVYAQLELAKKRGITATPGEVVELIRMLPAFRMGPDGTYGDFSKERYTQAMSNLSRIGATQELAEEALRDLVILNKMGEEVRGSVFVTQDEAEKFYMQFNEKMLFKTAAFQAENFRAKIKPSNEELNAFFKERQRNYQIPIQLQAQVVRFPFDDAALLREAAAEATPTALKNYFDRNQTLFGKDGEAPKSYDAVKAEVAKQFTANKVRELAYRKAQLFARGAYDKIADTKLDKANEFRALAAAAKLKLISTGNFNATDEKAGTIAEPELVRQLAQVDPRFPVSHAVRGQDAAYVGFATSFVPARPAAFDEVKKQVNDDYVRETGAKMAAKAAEEQYAKLNAILDGAARAKAFDAMKDCKMETIPEQTMQPGMAMPIEDLPVNGVSAPMAAGDGAVLVLMVKRTPADPATFAKDSEVWKLRARSHKEQMAQMALSEYLQQNVRMSESLR